MEDRAPFPSHKYAHLTIDSDGIILDGNRVVAIMADPFPIAFGLIDDPEEYDIEGWIRKGYIVPGFEKYRVNELGIVARPRKIPGYKPGSITVGMNGLAYFGKVCVGEYDYILEEPNSDLSAFLEEKGIEFNHCFGVRDIVVEPWNMEQHLYIVKGYNIDGGMIWGPAEVPIVRHVHDGYVLVGQLIEGKMTEPTPSLINLCKNLGIAN